MSSASDSFESRFGLFGLYDWWKFEEASGNRVGAINGTVLTQNNGVGQAAGKLGNAASFNAVNQYLSIANPSAFDGITKLSVSLWFKTNASGASYRTLLAVDDGATEESFEIVVGGGEPNEITVFIATVKDFSAYVQASQNFDAANQLPQGFWHHLAVVFDGALLGNANRLKAWTNGIAVNFTFSELPDPVPAALLTTAGPLVFGCLPSPLYPLDGFIDSPSIFPGRAFTAAEVAYLALGKPLRGTEP